MYGLKFLMTRLKRDRMCRSFTHIAYPRKHTIQLTQARTFVTRRVVTKPATELTDDESNWPRKIFSGIQPTGAMHLGNYLGAIKKWTELQGAHEDVTFCIVDMHSITLPQDPVTLRENIFKLAATMLACGIDPNQSTIFVQSAVKEHSELCWLLGTICTMARLGHLPQYKDKTRQLKEIPLGLFVYPILQAADIMLYKSTHVPVGEDQVQHIQLTQQLAKTFNSRFGLTFPVCHAMLENKHVSRVRSLRDPSKKMSKSDPDPKSVIFITDDADVVVEKVKKAITDFCSDVSYDPDGRPGVSNLLAIHSHLSGQSIEQIVNEARQLDTGKYKLRVAECINEYLEPIRSSIKKRLENRNELISILDNGSEKARNVAFDTVEEVKHRMGLGAPYLPLYLDTIKPTSSSSSSSNNSNISGGGLSENVEQKQHGTLLQGNIIGGQTSASKHILEAKLGTIEVSRKLSAIQKPSVPQQRLRVEKTLVQRRLPSSTATNSKSINIVNDITKELLHKGLLRRMSGPKASSISGKTPETENFAVEMREPLIRRVARCVDPKSPPTIVPPVLSSLTQTIKHEVPIISSIGQSSNRVAVGISPLTTATTPATAAATVVATAAVTSTAIATTTTKSSTLTLAPNANVQSLSIMSKTTLPAAMPAWSSTKPTTGNSNGVGGERSAPYKNETTTTTTTPSKKFIRIATKTGATTTLEPIKRYLTTTPLQRTFKKDIPPTSSACQAQRPKQKIIKLLMYGAFALGVGFSGVFYFWRSVLSAFFDTKRNGGS